MARLSHAPVRNPLTLMAVFAGLAEVAATIALPRLSGDVQIVFVWFTVGFPFSIVVPFFIFLWLKPQHLYAPGDYRKDPSHLTGEPPPAPLSLDRKKTKSKTPRPNKKSVTEGEV